MAAIAEMSGEAKERLKDFLEKRAAKVLAGLSAFVMARTPDPSPGDAAIQGKRRIALKVRRSLDGLRPLAPGLLRPPRFARRPRDDGWRGITTA